MGDTQTNLTMTCGLILYWRSIQISLQNQEPRQQSAGVECVQDEVVLDVVNVNDDGVDCVQGAQ